MKDNVIILTTGSSGSSVLAGLIATQGYWLGEETKKLQFDTYENAELVDLNIEILRASGFNRYDCNDIPSPDIENIKKVAGRIDLRPFKDFLDKCNDNTPWLWKDPRLSFTIHFWAQIVDLSSAQYIFIDREPIQSWTGLILKRQVPISYRNQQKINISYRNSCKVYFLEQKINCATYTFENLLLDPDALVNDLNSELGINLSMKDIKSIYKGPLYRKRYNLLSYVKARLFYMMYIIKGDRVNFPRV